MSHDATSLPPRPSALAPAAHKGDAGRVVALAGQREMPGAALLAVGGALRAGAGLVTLGCLDAELLALLPTSHPEALLWDLTAGDGFGWLEAERLGEGLDERGADVVLCGPGIGLETRGRRLVETVLRAWSGPLVLDADALTLVAGDPTLLDLLRTRGQDAVTVLTPHPGEALRLLGGLVAGRDEPEGEPSIAGWVRDLALSGGLGDDAAARRAAAKLLADELAAVVCLKGAGTVVSGGATTWTNPSGNPGLATGGTGDVLAGCLAAYLVPTARAPRGTAADLALGAARAAVYVHGLAGDRVAARIGRRALLAGDLLDELGPAELEGPWAG